MDFRLVHFTHDMSRPSAHAFMRALDRWRTRHGGYPRFVIIAHGEPEPGATSLFPPPTMVATDERPADRAGIWIVETDELNLDALTGQRQKPYASPMAIRFGTGTFDVLAYACEFENEITVDEIAHQTGGGVAAIRSVLSRLRRLGLVRRGKAIRPTPVGRATYERGIQTAGITF